MGTGDNSSLSVIKGHVAGLMILTKMRGDKLAFNPVTIRLFRGVRNFLVSSTSLLLKINPFS